MKTYAWVAAFGIVVGLLAAGLVLLLGRPPVGSPIVLEPLPTPGPILVHVAGAVNHPGVYALPMGSRAQDAVQAAGGFSSQADDQAINLAVLLQDGGRVFVPAIPTAAPADTGDAGQQRSASVIFPININYASVAELETLPEIGPIMAQAIVTYRQDHGAFQTLEEIMEVPGIGSQTYETIKNLITIGDPP